MLVPTQANEISAAPSLHAAFIPGCNNCEPAPGLQKRWRQFPLYSLNGGRELELFELNLVDSIVEVGCNFKLAQPCGSQASAAQKLAILDALLPHDGTIVTDSRFNHAYTFRLNKSPNSHGTSWRTGPGAKRNRLRSEPKY